MIYSPGRSLGSIRSSSLDIVVNRQFLGTQISISQIQTPKKSSKRHHFATCAGAWSIRGYFRQLGCSAAQPIIASRIGEPWNACLYNFSSRTDCSLLCLQCSVPAWHWGYRGYSCVSTVSSFSMLPLWAMSTCNMLPVSTEHRACNMYPVLAGWVWGGVTGASVELSSPAGGDILTLEMLLSATSRGRYSHISHELPAPCRARRAVALTAPRPVSGRARPSRGASPG